MSTILRIPAPLDSDFRPAALFNRHYVQATKASGKAVRMVIGLEREDGLLSRYETIVKPDTDGDTLWYVGRMVDFLLWARGGWRIWFGGPRAIGEYLRRWYLESVARAFAVDLMSRVYERPFEVVLTDAHSVPPENETGRALGGHLDGCRIGFDLGASDYKVAALEEGKVVYSAEFPWNPKEQPDPKYHYDLINASLKKAAAHLPRVDAIGGSSAGVVVNSKIMVASLFRAVPAANFNQAQYIFLRLRDEWQVPLEVVNDGDVAALAGAMSLKANGLLGVAMGSSQAAGYRDPQGRIRSWLSELAFAPVDYNPNAAADEWSGIRGAGVLYFSQEAVNKLLPAAKISLPSGIGLPERLEEVQALLAKGDPRATKIYETIGVYLGYTVPHYAEFYAFSDLLVLGRVTTGGGGNLVLDQAREVLSVEFPEVAEKIRLHVPDENGKRVGQAVAAASLPRIKC